MNAILSYRITVQSVITQFKVLTNMKSTLFFSFLSLCLSICFWQCTTKTLSTAAVLEVKQIQGHWVRNDYLSLLEVTKSPLLARTGAEGIASMVFDVSNLEGDSLAVGMNFNNHEGGEFYLFVDKLVENQKSYLLKMPSNDGATNSYCGIQLEYAKDTTLLLIEYDAAQKPSAVFRYTCISHAKNLPVDAVQYALNQRLLEGTYRIEDTKQLVTFSRDGKVQNWTNYAQYAANTDFVVGNWHTDLLSFYRKEADFSGATDFAFTINGDTLRLYELEISEKTLSYQRKSIKHVLFKVK
jgi:hypothetical protein